MVRQSSQVGFMKDTILSFTNDRQSIKARLWRIGLKQGLEEVGKVIKALLQD
jgi:hypothetical protein